MANPTTAKPAVPEWDSTANPNLQFLCVFDRDAGPRDVVGNVPARPYDGNGGHLSGLPPAAAQASFGSVVNQKTFKWGNCSKALTWLARGYAAGTTVGTARTFAITFRHFYPSGKNLTPSNNAAVGVALFGSGSDGNGVGLDMAITADGVVTLRTRRGGSQGSTDLCGGKTFDANTWYTVYVSYTSATARNSNYYDHAAQSAGTKASFTDSSYSWGSGSFANNVYIMNPTTQGGYNSGLVEVYAACIANEDWDSAVNATKFSDFYADPCLWARGSYAPGVSALAAGKASKYTTSTAAIGVAASRPTGGASSGVYTYQWHKSQAGPAFTPDATTLISGATAQTYTDTAVAAGATWHYRCGQSDGTSTVYTHSVSGYRPRVAVNMLLLGDSLLTAGSVAPHGMSAAALRSKCRLSWINGSRGARFAGTATNSVAGQSFKPGHWTIQPNGTISGGTYTLTWRGQTTSALNHNASAATIKTALEGLSTVGVGNVLVFGAGTPATNNAYGALFSGAALSGGVVSGDVLTCASSVTGGGTMEVWSEYRCAVLAAQADPVGITDVYVALGTNDRGLLSSSAATFAADLTYLCGKLLAEGFARIWLASPPHRWQNDDDANAEGVRAFEAAVDGVCNGSTIRRGAKLYTWSVGDYGQYDGLHWCIGGFQTMGFELWNAVGLALDPTNPALAGGGSGGGGPRGRR